MQYGSRQGRFAKQELMPCLPQALLQVDALYARSLESEGRD